jgi:hypothetical protein
MCSTVALIIKRASDVSIAMLLPLQMGSDCQIFFGVGGYNILFPTPTVCGWGNQVLRDTFLSSMD